MLLISKSKFVLLFLMLLVLAACAGNPGAGGPKTRVLGEASKQHQERAERLTAVEDSELDNKDSTINLGKSTSALQDINQRLPIFVLTGSLNNLSSVYGQSVCDYLNNDFLNNKYICIIQPLSNLQDAKKYLKKDDLSSNAEVPLTADFLVTRTDYLIQKQKNNTGPLKDFPTLDAVMFLSGSYLYVWGDPKYKSIELSHFVNKFNEENGGKRVVIAIVNAFAKELLTKIILANKWNANFEFIALNPNSPTLSNELNFDVIAYAGTSISQGMEDYIQNNRKNFVPLDLSDDLILNTQKANPEISATNVADYYSTKDLTNVTKVIASLDNNTTPLQSKTGENGESSSASNSKANTAVTENNGVNESKDGSTNNNAADNAQTVNNKLPPFVTGVRYGPGYDKYVFGKSRFDFKLKSVNDILKTDKLVDIRGIKVNSIGIRDVLVATRATNALKVFDMMSAFLEKYDLMKINYPTADMRNFTLRDLVLGDLYNNSLVYHYGVINFVTYAQGGNNNKVSEKEATIINIINRNLAAANTPPFYGPKLPSGNQINVINEETHRKIIMRQQEKALEDLNSVIEKIKIELALPAASTGVANEIAMPNATDLNTETAIPTPNALNSNATPSDSAAKAAPTVGNETAVLKEEAPASGSLEATEGATENNKANQAEAAPANSATDNTSNTNKANTITELPDDLKALLPAEESTAAAASSNSANAATSSDTSASTTGDNNTGVNNPSSNTAAANSKEETNAPVSSANNTNNANVSSPLAMPNSAPPTNILATPLGSE